MGMDHKDVWLYAVKNNLSYDIYFLHACNFPGYTYNVLDHAAMIGNMEIFYFLLINRLEEGCSKNAFYWACAYGQTEIIKILYLFFPEKCNILECIKIAKNNKNEETLNLLNTIHLEMKNYYYAYHSTDKCNKCDKKITIKNTSYVKKNVCIHCHFSIPTNLNLSCHMCNTKITDKNSSRIRKKCKSCYNYVQRTYKKQNKQKKIEEKVMNKLISL